MYNPKDNFTVKKFLGSLLGVNIGDCIGYPYENENNFLSFKTIRSKFFSSHSLLKYSDDTAFTFDIGKSLIKNKGLDIISIFDTFKNRISSQPYRSYGKNIKKIVNNLSQTVDDIYREAKIFYDGQGSMGNGAAMRIAPITLFYFDNDFESIIKPIVETSLITHAHPIAIYGALLQAFTLRQALVLPPPVQHGTSIVNGKSLALETCKIIKEQIQLLSSSNYSLEIFVPEIIDAKSPTGKEQFTQLCQEAIDTYLNKIDKITEIICKNEKIPVINLVNILGNGVCAHESVPIAIYFFIKALVSAFDAQKNSTNLESTLFLDTIFECVSCGGDTDTVASMTGSLLGAWIGYDDKKTNLEPNVNSANAYYTQMLPPNVNGEERFEGFSEAIDLATKLYSF